MNTRNSRTIERLKRLGFVFLLCFLGLYFGSGIWIGREVHRTVRHARDQHGGASVPALMKCVQSRHCSLSQKNRAVWALGQLGDPRALPLLEQYLTGKSCDHVRQICQKELQKAIRLCDGGVNITAWIWRL